MPAPFFFSLPGQMVVGRSNILSGRVWQAPATMTESVAANQTRTEIVRDDVQRY
jgi:hypothetical protein